MVDDRRGELCPEFLIEWGAGELTCRLLELLTELFGGLFASGKTNDRECRW